LRPRCGRFVKRADLLSELEKKTLITAEQEREDVAQKRSQWKCDQVQIDPDRVVFIDETWAKTNMTQTYLDEFKDGDGHGTVFAALGDLTD
jgi:hypothetical protein